MNRRLLAVGLLAGSCLSSLGLASIASAQVIPPIQTNLDANGIDRSSGFFFAPFPALTIGGAGRSGLSVTGAAPYQGYNADNGGNSGGGGTNWGMVIYAPPSGAVAGSPYNVVLGHFTDSFTLSGGVFTSTTNLGATLVATSAGYLYTQADGTQIAFNLLLSSSAEGSVYVIHRASTITFPTGEVITLSWASTTYCKQNLNGQCVNPAGQPSPGTTIVRLQSVTSSLGYQLQYNYQPSIINQPPRVTSASAAAAWNTLASITATGPTSNSSPPTMQFSQSGATETVTDPVGRVYAFTFNTTNGVTTQSVQTPGNSSPNITYNGTTLVNNGLSYSYSGSTSGSTLSITETDPLGHTNSTTANTITGQILTSTDGLGKTTTNTYNSLNELTSTVFPEGDQIQYAYDGRGNVTTTTHVPKSGSGLANIVTSATYPSTCSTAACNEPSTTTDAKGNVTSYTYDSYGDVLTVTSPSVNGVSAQTTNTYQQYATTSGNPNVVRLYQVSQCQTTNSCSGTADQVLTTLSYTPTSVLPSAVTKASGSGSVSATTSLAYDAVGDVATITDPLGNQTAFLYDADREPVGAMGPDPDGSGPLLNRAVRLTYDAGGRVSLTEQGTTSGQTAAAFSNFSSLSQLATTYNAINEKLSDAAKANGVTYALTQYAYDAAGRLQCTAVRMNVSAFSSDPGACSLGTQGSYGPDRISYVTYDNDNRPLVLTTGYGTSASRTESSTGYGADGELIDQVDAKGNLTTYNVDGFNRQHQIFFPNPANGGVSSTTDYEQYTYDANSNLTQDRRRDGSTISYSYDALNRPTTTVILPRFSGHPC